MEAIPHAHASQLSNKHCHCCLEIFFSITSTVGTQKALDEGWGVGYSKLTAGHSILQTLVPGA